MLRIQSTLWQWLGSPDGSSRAMAIRSVVLLALLVLPAVAIAYPGEQMVTWARNSIVAPLCFLAIAVSVCVALVRPQLASIAVWVTVISLFLMWILSNGQAITSQLQSSN
jgi:hypothetical protein